MALPEPTPPLHGEAARALKKRLDSHRMASEVREIYRGARAAYERKKPAE